jgi:D-tyrosyl-tRNA(Tyr) deacylase
MRLLLQRVKEAKVLVNEEMISSIGQGMLVLCAFGNDENPEDFNRMARKLISLRMFADESGNMNRSLNDVDASVLVVSQFTLFAQTKKGNRPSFVRSAPAEIAREHYQTFIKMLEEFIPGRVCTGIFGANMQVHLVNDGPVTLWMDSTNLE